MTMLAARAQAIKVLKQQHPFVEEGHLLSKLMAYCSKEAHSCVEKAAMISFVKLRILEPDEKCSLRADTLRKVRSDVFLFGGSQRTWSDGFVGAKISRCSTEIIE